MLLADLTERRIFRTDTRLFNSQRVTPCYLRFFILLCSVCTICVKLFEYSAFKPGSGCRTAILCVVTRRGCVADYFWMYYTESNRHFFTARQAIQFWRLTHHVTLVLWYHVELLSKPACSYLQESINKLHVQATIFLRQTSSRTEFFPWTQGRHWTQWSHLQGVVFSLHCC